MSLGSLEAVLARPLLVAESEHRCGPYRARLAHSDEERSAAFRLRFEVFNLELNEGLDTAYRTGYDVDEFDSICDHLIVEHSATNRVVGTYRLQSGQTATENAG